jgi:hypothetical protein
MFLHCFFLSTGATSQPRQAWQQVPLPPATAVESNATFSHVEKGM